MMNEMKTKTLFILALLFLSWALTSCQNKSQTPSDSSIPTDTITMLQHVQERGVLRAVTNCETINYNTQNPTPSGFEYELLSDFCKNYNLKL